MTDHDTGEQDKTEVPPLPAELMARIGLLKPPPPEADFWDRLHVAFDSDSKAAPALPGVGSPSRYRMTLLAVAALVVVAGVGLQLLTARRFNSADDRPAPGAAATAPSEPSAEPAPTTTASVVADSDQQGPPTVPGSDAGQPGQPDDPGSDGAGAGVTVAVDPETPSEVDATAPRATTSIGPEPASTTAPPASATSPLRLEAEDNDRATDGAATWEGWQLWGNGHIEHVVTLAPGNYSISVMAQGMAKAGTRPRMELRIDGQAVGSTLVSLDAYRLYTFEVTVGPAGADRLDIAFTNDPNRPDNDVDLKIDHTTITPAR